jgi:hypothetical protein
MYARKFPGKPTNQGLSDTSSKALGALVTVIRLEALLPGGAGSTCVDAKNCKEPPASHEANHINHHVLPYIFKTNFGNT